MIHADEEPVYVHTEEISEADLRDCARISGEASDAPLGIAFVIALRTLMGSGLVPDNAMMLGHRVVWHTQPLAGLFVTEMSIAAADPPRTRFQRVVIAYRTMDSHQGGLLVTEQEQEVLWPVTL